MGPLIHPGPQHARPLPRRLDLGDGHDPRRRSAAEVEDRGGVRRRGRHAELRGVAEHGERTRRDGGLPHRGHRVGPTRRRLRRGEELDPASDPRGAHRRDHRGGHRHGPRRRRGRRDVPGGAADPAGPERRPHCGHRGRHRDRHDHRGRRSAAEYRRRPRRRGRQPHVRPHAGPAGRRGPDGLLRDGAAGGRARPGHLGRRLHGRGRRRERVGEHPRGPYERRHPGGGAHRRRGRVRRDVSGADHQGRPVRHGDAGRRPRGGHHQRHAGMRGSAHRQRSRSDHHRRRCSGQRVRAQHHVHPQAQRAPVRGAQREYRNTGRNGQIRARLRVAAVRGAALAVSRRRAHRERGDHRRRPPRGHRDVQRPLPMVHLRRQCGLSGDAVGVGRRARGDRHRHHRRRRRRARGVGGRGVRARGRAAGVRDPSGPAQRPGRHRGLRHRRPPRRRRRRGGGRRLPGGVGHRHHHGRAAVGDGGGAHRRGPPLRGDRAFRPAVEQPRRGDAGHRRREGCGQHPRRRPPAASADLRRVGRRGRPGAVRAAPRHPQRPRSHGAGQDPQRHRHRRRRLPAGAEPREGELRHRRDRHDVQRGDAGGRCP